MLVCKILDNDLTEYQVCYNLNFKKPLDSFSPQIERKRSKKYLVIILAGKESFERFSCLEFVFEKIKHREAGLKHKLKVSATLQERPRADRCSFSCFSKNPYKPYIF